MNLPEIWLTKAEHDLISAKVLKNHSQDLYDTSIFHAQQSAEKSFKAYFAYKEIQIPRTHDLEILNNKCIQFDKGFVNLEQCAINLIPYSTEFRYPGIAMKPDIKDLEDAIKCADKIFNFIKQK